MILGIPFARRHLQRGPRVDLGRYFWRRVTRLEPPYILALVLLLGLKLAGGRGDLAILLPHFGASVVYLHNLIYHEPSAINFVAWSLEVEIQFYLLAPLLARIFAVRPTYLRRTLLLLGIVGTTWLAQIQVFGPITHPTLAGNLQFFLAGFLLADLFLSGWESGAVLPWDLVSLAGWPLLSVVLVRNPAWLNYAAPFAVLLLYIAAFRGPYSARLFGSLPFASIGGACYSIYLLHNYLIAITGMVTERVGNRLGFEPRLAIQLLLVTPLVLAGSLAFYLLVEQPTMRPDWPARLRAFFRPATPKPVSAGV